MKKTLLSAALAASLPSLAFGSPFLAKQVGQGFTGVTGDFTQAQYNPALLAKFEANDDFFFTLGGGLFGSDQDDLIDSIEETQDLLDDIEQKIDMGTATQADAEQLNEAISKLNDNVLTLDQGSNLMLAFPMQWLSLGLFVNQELKLGTSFHYSEEDADIIEQGISSGVFDAEDLTSGGAAVGVNLLEGGFILAKSWQDETMTLEYGTALKYQRLDLFTYAETIYGFDDDDFDADDHLIDDSQFNFDLGLQLSWGSTY